jgi:hypothetical protein
LADEHGSGVGVRMSRLSCAGAEERQAERFPVMPSGQRLPAIRSIKLLAEASWVVQDKKTIDFSAKKTA